MIKAVLYITLFLLCSCVSTEITEIYEENDNVEILFSSVQLDNSITTKASTTALTGNETFGVSCLFVPKFSSHKPAELYFVNEELTKTGDKWTLKNGPFYYPLDFRFMQFIAYGKSYTGNKPDYIYFTSGNSIRAQWTEYSIAQQDEAARMKYEDFVFSNIAQIVAPSQTVSFKLYHPLAKINFTGSLSYELPTIDAKITQIAVQSYDKGKFGDDSGNQTWESIGNQTEKNIELVANNPLLTLAGQQLSVLPLYVIPTTDITITVQAVLYNKGDLIPIGYINGSTLIDQKKFKIPMNGNVTFNIKIDCLASPDLAEIKFSDPTLEDWNSEEQI